MNNKLAQIYAPHISQEGHQLISAAYDFAVAAHQGQVRSSGDPFVSHPIAVAQILADWKLDATTLAAALLHDTVEDTTISLSELEKNFGAKVAELVDGVTKLRAIDAAPTDSLRHEVSNENIRKLLLAMTKDIRVIIIKLADRLHNLQTLKYLPADRQRRIAEESLEIYAPLADRLGMGVVKSEIEDLSFRYYLPEAYREVASQVSHQIGKTQRYMAKLKRHIKDQLAEAGLNPISIEGRQKHLFSIYKKLKKVDGDFDKIYDLVAIRIIVEDIDGCYKALGVLHQNYKPLIYRIKDYIAVPKPNGYKSLHTTVFALEGRITEFQIRTPEMHEESERGLAAHFFYDTQKGSQGYREGKVKALPGKFHWVTQLADLTSSSLSGQEFADTLRLDLFRDRIFVFSPQGDLYDLPEGSTPVDFAFAVHTSLGLHLQGAKVNGKLVPIDTKLENRDVVTILRRKSPAPNRDWLNFVLTPHARNKIRAWFRTIGREANITSGRDMLERELRTYGYKSLEEVAKQNLEQALGQLHSDSIESLLAAIGEGSVSVAQVMRRLFPEKVTKNIKKNVVENTNKTKGALVILGAAGMPHTLAPCCNPVFPASIVGYVTRGRGITVHTRTCPNLPKEPDRMVVAYWEGREYAEDSETYHISVVAVNRLGLLRDVTSAIASMALDIESITSTNLSDGQTSQIDIQVNAVGLPVLSQVIQKIERVPSVLSVQRNSKPLE